MTNLPKRPSVDIVVPIYNEASVAEILVERLETTFSDENREEHSIGKVCFLFVDDGSSDDTIEKIQRCLAPSSTSRIVRFSRNFGHQAAVSAGLRHSEGDLVAVIDADLQDPPELILDMIEKCREGFDVVYGQRNNRRASPIKKLAYWLFYRIYRYLSPIEVAMDSGDFCLMSRRAVDALNSLPESERFVRGLRSWIGFPQCGIPYDRPERQQGKSKYGFSQLYKLATDGIASLSIRPLKLAQTLAICYFLFSCIATGFLLNRFVDATPMEILVLILLLISLVGNGITMFCIYVLGAYIGRGYLESKRRPVYVVAERLDNSHHPKS